MGKDINGATTTTKELIEKVGADALDGMDCRPDRREDTGIETPGYIQEEIQRRKAAREQKPDPA